LRSAVLAISASAHLGTLDRLGGALGPLAQGGSGLVLGAKE